MDQDLEIALAKIYGFEYQQKGTKQFGEEIIQQKELKKDEKSQYIGDYEKQQKRHVQEKQEEFNERHQQREQYESESQQEMTEKHSNLSSNQQTFQIPLNAQCPPTFLQSSSKCQNLSTTLHQTPPSNLHKTFIAAQLQEELEKLIFWNENECMIQLQKMQQKFKRFVEQLSKFIDGFVNKETFMSYRAKNILIRPPNPFFHDSNLTLLDCYNKIQSKEYEKLTCHEVHAINQKIEQSKRKNLILQQLAQKERLRRQKQQSIQSENPNTNLLKGIRYELTRIKQEMVDDIERRISIMLDQAFYPETYGENQKNIIKMFEQPIMQSPVASKILPSKLPKLLIKSQLLQYPIVKPIFPPSMSINQLGLPPVMGPPPPIGVHQMSYPMMHLKQNQQGPQRFQTNQYQSPQRSDIMKPTQKLIKVKQIEQNMHLITQPKSKCFFRLKVLKVLSETISHLRRKYNQFLGGDETGTVLCAFEESPLIKVGNVIELTNMKTRKKAMLCTRGSSTIRLSDHQIQSIGQYEAFGKPQQLSQLNVSQQNQKKPENHQSTLNQKDKLDEFQCIESGMYTIEQLQKYKNNFRGKIFSTVIKVLHIIKKNLYSDKYPAFLVLGGDQYGVGVFWLHRSDLVKVGKVLYLSNVTMKIFNNEYLVSGFHQLKKLSQMHQFPQNIIHFIGNVRLSGEAEMYYEKYQAQIEKNLREDGVQIRFKLAQKGLKQHFTVHKNPPNYQDEIKEKTIKILRQQALKQANEDQFPLIENKQQSLKQTHLDLSSRLTDLQKDLYQTHRKDSLESSEQQTLKQSTQQTFPPLASLQPPTTPPPAAKQQKRHLMKEFTQYMNEKKKQQTQKLNSQINPTSSLNKIKQKLSLICNIEPGQEGITVTGQCVRVFDSLQNDGKERFNLGDETGIVTCEAPLAISAEVKQNALVRLEIFDVKVNQKGHIRLKPSEKGGAKITESHIRPKKINKRNNISLKEYVEVDVEEK